ncbi:hypothetical protein [Actinomadura sp. HBU206391]|uniref:hypothetical protein n=1 Tax=Actinomadura sp. HBU206391 TaxID=2731692 RepID=UPI00164EFA17|nr:hypothetical protein [Actinomadura sp. HBU206391]MBC6460413.1 hypothetical protein [Actinomadura sp. HBU206391]
MTVHPGGRRADDDAMADKKLDRSKYRRKRQARLRRNRRRSRPTVGTGKGR